MFILIHGEDQVKTRLELQHQISIHKQSGITDIVTLNGAGETLDNLIQNLESNSLLGSNHRLTIIENLHKKRSKIELKEITEYLKNLDPSSVNLIIWENRDLTPTQIKNLRYAKVIQAKLSPTIFKLTDALIPNADINQIVDLMHQACHHDSAEMVIIMLARQLRLLIQTFDPAAKLPPWQKAKLTLNAKKFGLDRLIDLHHQLAEIDYNNKTGGLASNLQSELEFWLISLYTQKV